MFEREEMSEKYRGKHYGRRERQKENRERKTFSEMREREREEREERGPSSITRIRHIFIRDERQKISK